MRHQANKKYSYTKRGIKELKGAFLLQEGPEDFF